jgi:hypothetical protein
MVRGTALAVVYGLVLGAPLAWLKVTDRIGWLPLVALAVGAGALFDLVAGLLVFNRGAFVVRRRPDR